MRRLGINALPGCLVLRPVAQGGQHLVVRHLVQLDIRHALRDRAVGLVFSRILSLVFDGENKEVNNRGE